MKRFFFTGQSSHNNTSAAAAAETTTASLLSTPTRVPLRKKSDTTAALVAAATTSSSSTPPSSPCRTRSQSAVVVTSPTPTANNNAILSPSRGRCHSSGSAGGGGGGHVGMESSLLFSSPPDVATGSNNSGRVRLNSRDISRTYSGLYGSSGDDLLPFELSRGHSTLTTAFKRKQYQGILLGLYVTILILVQIIIGMILNVVFINASSSSASSASQSSFLLDISWTCTNVLHTLISLVYIHWMKGSCLYPADDNGEMNALTLWEQLDATPNTRWLREALMLVPCLLTWIACHATDYQWKWSLLNGSLWIVSMLGKLPCMNGVRIFGINRTVGIDDDLLGMDDDDDNMPDVDMDSTVLYQHSTTASTEQYQQQQQQPIRDRTGSTSSTRSGNYALLGKKSQ